MADSTSDRYAPSPASDAWQRDNERGLVLAADGDWGEASEAFAAAADALARVLPSETRSVHEPLALVLSNLAQAYFRIGRLDDAMQQAQRVCALRVAIAGEDGMPVARARMDLAVMLASAGRLDEAGTLIQRAIAGVEHRVGEEDARLAIVLENAARIALAGGHPANAEPLLLRLHALLDAHELSTVRAEGLLARVAELRARQQVVLPATEVVAAAVPEAVSESVSEAVSEEVAAPSMPEAAASPTPVEETPALTPFDDDAMQRVYAHASIDEMEEWDDQPLRDAVAVTDVLLRTTPSGVPIIPPVPVVEPPSLEVSADNAQDADLLLDTMDLTDVLPAPSLREPDADALLSLELADEPTPQHPSAGAPPSTPALPVTAALVPPADDTAFDLDLAFEDLAPLPVQPVTEVPLPVSEPVNESVNESANANASGAPPRLVLDFAVEHGMVSDDEPLLAGPPISTPIPDVLDSTPPVPGAMPSALPAPAASDSPPVSAPATPAETRIERPRAAAEVHTGPVRGDPARDGQRTARRTAEERVVLPAPTPSKGKGGLIAIVAGVAAIGAAAAYFLLR